MVKPSVKKVVHEEQESDGDILFAGAAPYYSHHEYAAHRYEGGPYFEQDNINLGHLGHFYDSEDQTAYEYGAQHAAAAIGPHYRDYDEAMYKEYG